MAKMIGLGPYLWGWSTTSHVRNPGSAIGFAVNLLERTNTSQQTGLNISHLNCHFPQWDIEGYFTLRENEGQRRH